MRSTRSRYQGSSPAGMPMNSAITRAGIGYAKSATKSTTPLPASAILSSNSSTTRKITGSSAPRRRGVKVREKTCRIRV